MHVKWDTNKWCGCSAAKWSNPLSREMRKTGGWYWMWMWTCIAYVEQGIFHRMSFFANHQFSCVFRCFFKQTYININIFTKSLSSRLKMCLVRIRARTCPKIWKLNIKLRNNVMFSGGTSFIKWCSRVHFSTFFISTQTHHTAPHHQSLKFSRLTTMTVTAFRSMWIFVRHNVADRKFEGSRKEPAILNTSDAY